MRWVRHELDQRRALLPQLLRHIRLPLLPPLVLIEKVGRDALLRSDLLCRCSMLRTSALYALDTLGALITLPFPPPLPDSHRVRRAHLTNV